MARSAAGEFDLGGRLPYKLSLVLVLARCSQRLGRLGGVLRGLLFFRSFALERGLLPEFDGVFIALVALDGALEERDHAIERSSLAHPLEARRAHHQAG